MLRDILRFYRDARAFLAEASAEEPTLGGFLDRCRYGALFRRRLPAADGSRHLVGLGRGHAAVSRPGPCCASSTTTACCSLDDRPQWRTVEGGSRVYVERLAAPLGRRIRLATPALAVRRLPGGAEVVDGRGGRMVFDQVVLACHGDQALGLIEQPTAAERAVLGAFRYQRNRAVLHADPDLMPRRRAVWSSWNYMAAGNETKASVTYWLNRLQGIDPQCLALVSLNPHLEPAHERVIASFDYAHPQLDARGRRRARPPERDPGVPAAVVLRRVLGPRLPRRRPAARASRSPQALGVAPPWQGTRASPGPAVAMPATAAAGPA